MKMRFFNPFNSIILGKGPKMCFLIYECYRTRKFIKKKKKSVQPNIYIRLYRFIYMYISMILFNLLTNDIKTSACMLTTYLVLQTPLN